MDEEDPSRQRIGCVAGLAIVVLTIVVLLLIFGH